MLRDDLLTMAKAFRAGADAIEDYIYTVEENGVDINEPDGQGIVIAIVKQLFLAAIHKIHPNTGSYSTYKFFLR